MLQLIYELRTGGWTGSEGSIRGPSGPKKDDQPAEIRERGEIISERSKKGLFQTENDFQEFISLPPASPCI